MPGILPPKRSTHQQMPRFRPRDGLHCRERLEWGGVAGKRFHSSDNWWRTSQRNASQPACAWRNPSCHSWGYTGRAPRPEKCPSCFESGYLAFFCRVPVSTKTELRASETTRGTFFSDSRSNKGAFMQTKYGSWSISVIATPTYKFRLEFFQARRWEISVTAVSRPGQLLLAVPGLLHGLGLQSADGISI